MRCLRYASRQTDRRTDIQTRWSQLFANLAVRSKTTICSAIADGPCDALKQLKSCQLLHSCTKNHIFEKTCSRWMTLKITQGHRNQKRNHGWKSWRGPNFVSQHRGTCASRPARGRAGNGCESVSPSSAIGVREYHPQKSLKTQMLQHLGFQKILYCILVTTMRIGGLNRTCIYKKTTSMSRAKSVPKFQLFCHGCAPGC